MHDRKATRRRPPQRKRARSRATEAVPLARAERLLTVREVALMLCVCRPTVYKMIRRGELRAVYVHGMARLRPGVVETYARLHDKRLAKHRAKARRK